MFRLKHDYEKVFLKSALKILLLLYIPICTYIIETRQNCLPEQNRNKIKLLFI